VLAAAMEKGHVPSDQINGAATCTFDNPGGSPNPYSANNFSGSGTGSVRSIRSQTLSSSNCAYLRLGQIVGLSNVADTARALGITTDMSSLPISMPLGPLNVTPLDMATAYASFANDGLQVDPVFIERVEDRSGDVVFANEPSPSRAISVQSARLVTSILEANVRGGTGTAAQISGQTAAGKTGTGQSFKNAWFVGYTPYLATAVWMGNPLEEVEMRGVRIPELGFKNGITGGSAPAAIWRTFNDFYHAELDPLSFSAPAPTRSGQRIRTDDEEDEYNELIKSSCGDEESEVDEDEDGVVDFCEDSGFEFDPGIGRCPALLLPKDVDDDGEFDTCIPPTTTTTTTTIPDESTTTTTTTTTEPPTTTTAPQTTTTTTG
jgi:membrane peptidoglycan carboxypeptidase